MPEESSQPRERWGSRIGVILAVAGSAVGLGNFLRFPGQAASNGGGAFMLPYFISLLVLGIPLCWAEWTIGRYAGVRGFNSAPGIYRTIWKSAFAKYFGAFALMIPLIIYMYYVLIEAWCLGYAINYLTGDLMIGGGGEVSKLAEGITAETAAAGTALSPQDVSSEAYSRFFSNFVGEGADGALLQSGNLFLLTVLGGTFLLNFMLIYRGVTKGIETFCRFAMPLMVVLALIVLVRVLTLGAPIEGAPERNVLAGLGEMWNPEGDALWESQTWLAASGQIFFSLSVGFGIIINYASYLGKKDDIVLSGLTSSSMNEFFEVCLGGLITLPAAFIFMGAAAKEQGTFGLGFKALPNVFGQMPGGQFFGCLWFFMLFIAAVTSSVSMLQPVIAFFEEGFGLKRHASAAILGLLSALGTAFVFYFSANSVALDTFDFWAGTFLIYVLAMFQAILYAWVFGIKRGEREAHLGAHIRIPRFVQYMLKFVVPVYLLVIFAFFCIDSLPTKHKPLLASEENRLQASSEEITAALNAGIDETRALVGEGLEQDKAAIGEESTLVTAGNGWHILNKEGALTHVIKQTKDGPAFFANKPGYIKKIGDSPVALYSMFFIGAIFAFLMLLVHIAGSKWEREGRFDEIDKELEATQ